jgi:hypothetical protein
VFIQQLMCPTCRLQLGGVGHHGVKQTGADGVQRLQTIGTDKDGCSTRFHAGLLEHMNLFAA